MITDLQGTTTDLDFRVTEVEVRVETLDGTSGDQETRLTAAEANIGGKRETLTCSQ